MARCPRVSKTPLGLQKKKGVSQVKNNIVQALLRIRGGEWIPLQKIQEYVHPQPAPDVLEALRALWSEKRVQHQHDGEQDTFKLTDVAQEMAYRDAAWIRSALGLHNWTATGEEYYQCVATPTADFWEKWRKDKHYIKNRHLSVHYNAQGDWRVYCFDKLLSEILISNGE